MLQNKKWLLLLLFSKVIIAQKIPTINTTDACVDFGYCLPDSVRNPDIILIHTSYCIAKNDSFNLKCILKSYQKHQVAAHYIIDRQGVIHKMVNEAQVAYHGGKGTLPDSNTQINTRSIGIEIINTKNDTITNSQYFSLHEIVKNCLYNYKIKYITGHSDTAPSRKSDPWNFDWKYFKSLLASDSVLVWNYIK